MKPKPHSFLDSGIHRKVMLFFLENQGSIDTPRGVSAWVNENIKTVRVVLEDLVKSGFLKAHRTSSTVGYSSALPPKAASKMVKNLKIKR